MGMCASLTVKSGAIAALLVGLVACGSADRSAVEPPGDAVGPPASPLVSEDGELQLSCGEGPGFTASAMTGGVEDLADRDEVAAALQRLVDMAGMDAPTALQDTDIDETEWFMLGQSERELAVATGSWGRHGPGPHAQVVTLTQVAGGWEASSWGDCTLAPVLSPGLAWIEIGPVGEFDPSATVVPVRVNERGCASGRDPRPFLREPVIIESDESVTVYWTLTAPTGSQTCQGTLPVEQTLHLPQPLGNRVLLDGSAWPATPITDQ